MLQPALLLEGPHEVCAAAATAMDREGRMHDTLLPSLHEEGASAFGWVADDPSERRTLSIHIRLPHLSLDA